jgi:hypothetical protein
MKYESVVIATGQIFSVQAGGKIIIIGNDKCWTTIGAISEENQSIIDS